jgi:tRNA uridine 5-carboxymethylaminomethyl modification enzyme
MNSTCAYDFDVIVIGGGHAGIEAAHAAAKMGSKTLMVTINIDTIGLMPCNPAVGGVGKGHIVYEISALGGLMPKLCSKTYLQARMLNTRKGPAVQGLRLQIDKYAYNQLAKTTLENMENLTLRMGMVEEILIDDNRNVRGIRTRDGAEYLAPTLVITTGTFLNGKIHIGPTNYTAGRQGEEASVNLPEFLRGYGIQLGRLKTGTPPRLLRSSLDFSAMEKQEPDNLDYLFEFYPQKSVETRACYITHTNQKTHDIIKRNLHLSAMYSGNIQGVGPRYCPSIEDKISRFSDKTSHHVFVEPEGASTEEIYPNGLSTSLPFNVQKEYIQSIKGFEQAVISRPGYAVEYDFVHPHQLDHTLEVKSIQGLYLAGQINGTTGYEEAAGQGIVAGINAHLKSHKLPPFILDRTESYIGVMIDDLITFSVDEPYRMFTSRAERRLLLRQDNSFLRLTQRAYDLGLIDEQLYNDFKQEKQIIEQTLIDVRAGYNYADLLRLYGELECNVDAIVQSAKAPLSDRAIQTLYAEVRYEPYLKREIKEVEKQEQYRNLIIPAAMEYKDMPGLSRELQQKLTRFAPQTIAQAALIQGMTPAAISLLIFKVRTGTP